MTYRVFALWLLFAFPAVAQFDNGLSNRVGSVKVRVVFPQGGTCDSQTASLLSATGAPFGDAPIRTDCTVEFSGVPKGTYRLIVSARGAGDSSSDKFEVNSQELRDLEVRINPPVKSESNAAPQGGPLVPVVELKIPKEAKKEFARAGDLMAAENWKKAMERLNRAITIYPQFVDAYNNLGVVYARMGDRVHERDMLQKAISLDDHYAPAYVNLARADIAEQNFPHAEMLLDKATAINPNDVITLVLLANVELRTRHFNQVITTCSHAHSTQQPQHSIVHYLAALAFEKENRLPEALAELKVFLGEEADGPRATSARKEMAALRAAMR